ncbi:MAG: sigma-54-dependent Fis family transcriptional regulator [Acidimicrobiia bacterium]|nr:sigma-54-dependent Fis family transcriptional regulator [Acidimicrobiia bacterium]
MKARILVVDDETAIRDTMRMLLEYDGHDVIVAGSGQEGLTMVEREHPDLVFLDVKMPGMDGLEALSRLRGINDALPVVIVSAHGTTATALEAGRLGAFRFIEKPLSKDYVIDAVREGLELGSLRRENRQLRSALETRHQVIGDTSGLKRVMDQVRKAAPTNATVLILGESGAGKELIARAIHRNSLRAKERFIQVNCAAIPEELIESELFGHERGAFTGATDKQTGKFEQADRGTIFLDEVGDMSAKTQAKVLRVLQEGEVERLGSARTIKVDVRVIAATNKDLELEIAEGRFREDLYFRLSVIPLHAPPLRERLDDIPALVAHFSAQFSRENNRRPARFSAQALEALKQARWRGNVRELKNVVERLLIMSDRDVIEGADVRAVVRPADGTDPRPATAAAAPGSAPSGPVETAATLREFKETTERAWLVAKLRENAWNISKTAEVIDTPRSNLYKKLEQYRISQETDG